jgi:hypothetical protein
MQRIQTNAECIVLYASQRVELKYVERLMSNIRNSMLIGSISFALINFPIQLLSKLRKSEKITKSPVLAALNGMCTYVMPTVVFFFIQKTHSQELAQKYLGKKET